MEGKIMPIIIPTSDKNKFDKSWTVWRKQIDEAIEYILRNSNKIKSAHNITAEAEGDISEDVTYHAYVHFTIFDALDTPFTPQQFVGAMNEACKSEYFIMATGEMRITDTSGEETKDYAYPIYDCYRDNEYEATDIEIEFVGGNGYATITITDLHDEVVPIRIPQILE